MPAAAAEGRTVYSIGVSIEHHQTSTGCDVPQTNRAIARARHDVPLVSAELYRSHILSMTFEYMDSFAGVHIPSSNVSVIGPVSEP